MNKNSFNSFSHKGRDKPNQDRVLEPKATKNGYWCAIADGVGGNPGGAEAAECAVNSVAEKVESANKPSMSEIFAYATEKLNELVSSATELNRMATTLSVLHLQDDKASVGHVGDTRIYHLRRNGLVTRTQDQTEVQDLLDRGIINKREAKRYPRRNVLTGYLSTKCPKEIYEATFEVRSGDRLILLSDGAYNSVLKPEFCNWSKHTGSIAEFGQKILTEIENRPITDDYSALFIEILAEDTFSNLKA